MMGTRDHHGGRTTRNPVVCVFMNLLGSTILNQIYLPVSDLAASPKPKGLN